MSTPNGHCFKEENQPPYNPYHKTEFTKDEIFNLLEKSKWYIEEYLGQHPIKKNSQEIIHYRNFIKKFWKDKIRSETFGILYTLVGKIYRRLLNQKILDPAHLGDCSPKQITKEYEPAYHYLKLRLK